MLRVGKLTDYATVVMTHLARSPDRLLSASEIATDLGLNLPTVSKVLKALVQSGLLSSLRGVKGGYALARPAQEISVAEIIAAMEGPVSLTECSSADSACGQESQCSVRPNWQRINQAVIEALQQVSLAELSRPLETHPLVFTPSVAVRELRRS